MSIPTYLPYFVLATAVGIGVWLTSFAIEAMRSRPKPPAKLR